jgi:hypothetical protein
MYGGYMSKKEAYSIPRSMDITDEERNVAREALSKLNAFLKKLWSAQQHTERLMNVFGNNPEIQPDQLFKVRHLLRQFQKEVREHYSQLIPMFSDALESLDPLASDTETGSIKEILLDATQQLSQIVESFMETLDDFNAPDQIQRMKVLFQKGQQLAKSIESIVEGRLRDHFEKNIFRRKKIGRVRAAIKRRARLIKMMRI